MKLAGTALYVIVATAVGALVVAGVLMAATQVAIFLMWVVGW